MRELNFSVTPSQAEFLALKCPFPAFVGGVGSGKSQAMAIAAVIDASKSPSSVIALYEPTHDLIKRVILPRVEGILIDNGIRYNYNKQDHVMYISSSQFGDMIFRSLDNPTLIVGFESFSSHVDELDVLSNADAMEAWTKIMARNRQSPKGAETDINKVCAYSTPEGFKFMYKMWGRNTTLAEGSKATYISPNPDYQRVQAKTKENPFLKESFLKNLTDTYSGPLVAAYLEGEFVNLNSTTVYSAYNRDTHDSSEVIRDGEPLYIGCDFNVEKTAATIYVRRGNEWHAVAELANLLDADTLAQTIQEKWQNNGHAIVIYPDCSGASRSNANATMSAIGILQKARFEVRARRKNPDVRDRIMATNKAFNAGRVFINSRECPVASRCLEQQSYDKQGDPDKKSGNDHQNDATTYPIAYEMSIRKPLFAIDFSYMV